MKKESSITRNEIIGITVGFVFLIGVAIGISIYAYLKFT